MATDPSDIRLTDEQKRRLAEASDATGLSPDQLLEDALRNLSGKVTHGQTNGRTLYDAFAEDGAIGCIKGGPPDVSTNPRYMEGFGSNDSGTDSH